MADGVDPSVEGPASSFHVLDDERVRLYGPWARHNPATAAGLMDGFPAPWWISGGWSIEAFTHSSRDHDDVDVTIFRRDAPALRAHFGDRFHLWAVGSGVLRALTDEAPRVPRTSGQIWMREHALAPWQLDILLNPGTQRQWIFKRDPSVRMPLARATWLADDGLRYLRPELVLAHKLRLDRPKDRADLEATCPLLADDAKAWLRRFVQAADPHHQWLGVLTG